MAYKELNDFDRAKENLNQAIQYNPTDTMMRDEYKKLCAIKTTKEKEWNSKMQGFYNGNQLNKIERRDEEETLLREKIKRQTFDNPEFYKVKESRYPKMEANEEEIAQHSDAMEVDEVKENV